MTAAFRARRQALPRVLVFAPLPPPATGQSRVTASVVTALRRYAVVETVNTADPARVWRAPGRLPPGRAAGWGRALAALHRALRDRPDVVYLTPASSALGLVRDVLSVQMIPDHVPIVAHVHVGDWVRLLDDRRLGPLARQTARRYSQVLVPSHYAAQGLQERLPGLPVHVVPNSVPADVRVSASEIDAKWSRTWRPVPHVAFVSHHIPSKGYRRLLDAATEIEAGGQPLQVTFAGAWPSAARRKAFEAEIAAGPDRREARWRVAGLLSPPDVRALLLDADAFAFPSLYPHESLSLAALEAMQAGCGVAAIDHAGIGELIRDGVEGCLVAPEPPAAFAEALARVLADREGYGRAAAARVRDAFAPDAVEAAVVRAVLGPECESTLSRIRVRAPLS